MIAQEYQQPLSTNQLQNQSQRRPGHSNFGTLFSFQQLWGMFPFIRLQKYRLAEYNMYVAFSAASNVTGIQTDTVAVAELCHKYGALSFWDYASAGPYLKIDMNPTLTG